jgi:uncharacterized membrane protein YtjA (UPF0391 family)
MLYAFYEQADITSPVSRKEDNSMLYWALVFFIVSIVAAVLGFGGIAATTAGIAQILFYIFLVLFLVSLISGLVRRGTPGPL